MSLFLTLLLCFLPQKLLTWCCIFTTIKDICTDLLFPVGDNQIYTRNTIDRAISKVLTLSKVEYPICLFCSKSNHSHHFAMSNQEIVYTASLAVRKQLSWAWVFLWYQGSVVLPNITKHLVRHKGINEVTLINCRIMPNNFEFLL